MESSLEQILHGFYIKFAASVPLAWLTSAMGVQTSVLVIYLIFMGVDLILGAASAYQRNIYDVRRVRFWFFKLGTHLLILLVFGLVGKVINDTFGFSTGLTGALLFMIIITEAASVVDKLTMLGAPVPPFVKSLLSVLRKNAEAGLNTAAGAGLNTAADSVTQKKYSRRK